MKIEELKNLLKENNITFYSYWNKKKLLELADKNNLLPNKAETKQEPEDETLKYVNYERLRNIRHNPKNVKLIDVETGEEQNISSIYKAAQFINKSPQTLRYWGLKKAVWNNKYRIVIE